MKSGLPLLASGLFSWCVWINLPSSVFLVMPWSRLSTPLSGLAYITRSLPQHSAAEFLYFSVLPKRLNAPSSTDLSHPWDDTGIPMSSDCLLPFVRAPSGLPRLSWETICSILLGGTTQPSICLKTDWPSSSLLLKKTGRNNLAKFVPFMVVYPFICTKQVHNKNWKK